MLKVVPVRSRSLYSQESDLRVLNVSGFTFKTVQYNYIQFF